MNNMLYSVIFSSLFVSALCTISINNYYNERARILEDESRMTLGGATTLNEKETVVNYCLMSHKLRELDYCFRYPQYFNMSHHYFTYKDKMRHSKVFKIIKDLPKGAALHVHDMALLGPDYLINITYMDHLYVCFTNTGVNFRFSNSIPNITCDSRWVEMSQARNSSTNVVKFDKELRKHFSMVVSDPDTSYPDINTTWKAFINYFKTVASVLTYRPVWEQYFYEALKKFREDNLMYVEVRSLLPPLYELDGTVYDPMVTAKAYKRAIQKFTKDYPDFVGAKIIYAPQRNVHVNTVQQYIELAKKIKNDMPDFFAGFDLVGQEDMGGPLIEFVPQLIEAGYDMAFFFHAGETDWYGTLTDTNLVDAILLGAKRIGHAYALPKHPLLIDKIVYNDIGLEVNVISNTVLSLVRDVRNHPLSKFLAQGLPVVISSDDPGVWEADPISDDFYVTFVGAASRLSDLRLLKQLALNSLKYSTLNYTQKTDALSKFNDKWDSFILNFNCSSY